MSSKHSASCSNIVGGAFSTHVCLTISVGRAFQNISNILPTENVEQAWILNSPTLSDQQMLYFNIGKCSPGSGGGRYSRKFWIGVWRKGSWTLILFKDKGSKNWYPFKGPTPNKWHPIQGIQTTANVHCKTQIFKKIAVLILSGHCNIKQPFCFH